MKKPFLAVVAVISAVLTFLALSVLLGAPANATEAPKFEKYDTTQTWYAPSPASVDNPFAVPQTTKVLECGGIRQDDKYTIDTAELDKQYKALIAGGVLNSKWEDAPFHPRGVVTALPDCAPVVIVPEKPEKIVEESTFTGKADCVAKTYVVTTTVTTTDYVYNETTNSWDKGTPVPVSSDQTFPTTEIQCPTEVVVVVPPVDETPVETAPVAEVTPVAAAPVELAKVEAVKTDAKALTVVPVADSLAYTGTNENLKFVWAAGVALAGLGLILVLVARLRRGPVKAGVVNR